MNAILYYLSYPLIKLISLLPFWLLYRVSDVMYLIVFYVIGYRKEVVMNNLINSFPNKSTIELKSIQRKFYRYFCDLSLETIKSLSISPARLKKRVSINGQEIFQEYFDQKQSVIIAMGHWGNWELAGARFALEPVHQLYVIYHPLSNKYFDRFFYHMRTRLGNGLYAMKDTIRGMIQDKQKITATAFIADQTPSAKSAHWLTFLNQDTPVFRGMGKIANKMDYPIVYIGVKRIKRGFYTLDVEKLVLNSAEISDVEIIERFTSRLEVDIKEIPEIWLWTHRRWKHKRPQTNI